MVEIEINPQDEDQEQSFSPAVMRIGAIVLGLFFGFSTYILSYANLLFVLSEVPMSGEHVIGEFTYSILIWTMLGAFTPLWFIKDAFTGLFDFLRGSDRRTSIIRIAIVGVVAFVFLTIYWKLLELLVYISDTLFS